MRDRDSKDIDVFFQNPQIQQALSDLGLFWIDSVVHRSFASRLWINAGYTAEDMDNSRFPSLVHPDVRPEVPARFADLIAGPLDRS